MDDNKSIILAYRDAAASIVPQRTAAVNVIQNLLREYNTFVRELGPFNSARMDFWKEFNDLTAESLDGNSISDEGVWIVYLDEEYLIDWKMLDDFHELLIREYNAYHKRVKASAQITILKAEQAKLQDELRRVNDAIAKVQ